MKQYIILLLLTFPLLLHADETNCENAITTFDINRCIGRTAESADVTLGEYLAKAKEKYSQETAIIHLLDQSQNAWLIYRQAHCDAIYDMWSEGSIRGAMFGGCMLQLTKQRTHKIWEDYLTYMDSTPPLLPEPE